MIPHNPALVRIDNPNPLSENGRIHRGKSASESCFHFQFTLFVTGVES
jgi:hypothetical protein